MDAITYRGQAGIDLQKDNIGLTLGYTGQMGMTATHSVWGMFRVEF